MASRRNSDEQQPRTRRKPATTPEQREHQLVNLAMDLAEKQLRDGTASAQVVTHYLKLGSSREVLEQRRLSGEVGLIDAKKTDIEGRKRMEELMEEAMQAFRSYSGQDPDEQ